MKNIFVLWAINMVILLGAYFVAPGQSEFISVTLLFAEAIAFCLAKLQGLAKKDFSTWKNKVEASIDTFDVSMEAADVEVFDECFFNLVVSQEELQAVQAKWGWLEKEEALENESFDVAQEEIDYTDFLPEYGGTRENEVSPSIIRALIEKEGAHEGIVEIMNAFIKKHGIEKSVFLSHSGKAKTKGVLRNIHSQWNDGELVRVSVYHTTHCACGHDHKGTGGWFTTKEFSAAEWHVEYFGYIAIIGETHSQEDCEDCQKTREAKKKMRPKNSLQQVIYSHGFGTKYTMQSYRVEDGLNAFLALIDSGKRGEVCCSWETQHIGEAGVYISGEVTLASNADVNSDVNAYGERVAHRCWENLIRDENEIDLNIDTHASTEFFVIPKKICGFWVTKESTKSYWYKEFEKEAKARGFEVTIIDASDEEADSCDEVEEVVEAVPVKQDSPATLMLPAPVQVLTLPAPGVVLALPAPTEALLLEYFPAEKDPEEIELSEEEARESSVTEVQKALSINDSELDGQGSIEALVMDADGVYLYGWCAGEPATVFCKWGDEPYVEYAEY